MTESDIFERLREPFPREDLDVVKTSTSKDKKKTMWAVYVDARAVMSRLDEVLGPENWTVCYEQGPNRTKPDIMCVLSLRLGTEWITKTDGAGETDFEAIKGGYSGALRRAANVWGIGRYLYRVEGVWLSSDVPPWEALGHVFPRLPDWAKVPGERGQTAAPKSPGTDTPDRGESPQDAPPVKPGEENSTPLWMTELASALSENNVGVNACRKALAVPDADDWRLVAHDWLAQKAEDGKASDPEARRKFVMWTMSVQKKLDGQAAAS